MITVFNQYVSIKSILLMLLEGLLITLALICAAWVRFWSNPHEFASYLRMPDFALQASMMVLAFQVSFYYGDLYNGNELRGRYERIVSLMQSLGIGCLLLGALYYIFPGLLIGRGVFFIGTVMIVGFVMTTRIVIDRVWQAAAPRQNVAILGTGRLAAAVAAEIERRDDLNLHVAGFVDPSSPAEEAPAASHSGRVLGSTAGLERLIERHRISRIIVAMENRRGAVPSHQLVRLRMSGLCIQDAHSIISSLTGRIWLETIQPSWFVYSDGFRRSPAVMLLKRLGDIGLSVIGLLLTFPAMVLVAIAIKLDSKGPIFYRQERVGLNGRTFQLLKFRSMRVDAEHRAGAQWAALNDCRVTRTGKYLRKFRLDELPQFLNILRGEMSCVGPRPERPVFVEQLSKQLVYYQERHLVRPGLTGWAQVQYHYGASQEDSFRKLEYDLFYLKNLSLSFDALIVLKTFRIVLTGKGGR